MNALRRLSMVVAAAALTLLIASLQLAWNLRNETYLRHVAQRSQINETLAAALPNFAASKLPDAEATRQLFAQKVTPATVDAMLQPLYGSIVAAYHGKTDVVAFSLEPLLAPVNAAGYQIPPGTVFDNQTVQIGGLAGALRSAALSTRLIITILIISLILTLILGFKKGILKTLRSLLLLTSLILGGLFVATLGLPLLIQSVLASNSLDERLRTVVLQIISTIVHDAGHYYLVWMAVLVAASILLSLARSVNHRGQRAKPVKRQRKILEPPKTREDL